MAEFPDLGNLCALISCSQLDFLPFVCELCQQTFCLEHRSPVAHNCSSLPASPCYQYNGPTGTIEAYECALSTCKVRELMPVVCPKCSKNFCLMHRHPPDHECSSVTLVVKDSGKLNGPSKTVEAPICRGRKSQRTSLQVSLMKLKMKAKGLDTIPVADRVYFEIQLATGEKEDKSAMSKGYFFSKEWTAGRAVDFVASQEKLTNMNNMIGCKKLVLLTAEDGEMLRTDLTWSAILDQGISNGSALILQYTCIADS